MKKVWGGVKNLNMPNDELLFVFNLNIKYW